MGDNIVWLAAYPKTGSTWVRAILHQLLASKLRPVEAIRSFDKEYPEDSPWYRLMGTDAKLLRTHCNVDHPSFQAIQKKRSDQVVGVLTIQRHPLDVMLSQLNYSLVLERAKSFKNREIKPVEQIIADGEIGYYIDGFIEARGCPDFLGRCGTYPEFFTGWRDFAPECKHLHLRYEDLVQDRVGGVQRLIDFLGRPAPRAAKVARAAEERTEVNGKFFWRKQAYNFQSLLDDTAIARFECGFADGLESLGYAPTIRRGSVRKGRAAKPDIAAAAGQCPPDGPAPTEVDGGPAQALLSALDDGSALEEALATALRDGDELVSRLHAQEAIHAEQLKNVRFEDSTELRDLQQRLATAQSEAKTLRRQQELAAAEMRSVKQKYRAAQTAVLREQKAHAATRGQLERLNDALPVRAYRATARLLPRARARAAAESAARAETLDLIRKSGLFDAGWYRSRYPDVESGGSDVLAHFVDHGWKEGRDPGPNFSADEYLRRNPEVLDSGENPLVHYIRAKPSIRPPQHGARKSKKRSAA